MSSGTRGPLADPESLYAGWRVLRDQHGGPTFEAFCADNPTLRSELRAIHAEYERLRDLLPDGSTTKQKNQERAGADPGPFFDLISRMRKHQPLQSRYEERREIARGGMGRVLEVYDVDLRRAVAKKVMLADGDSSAGTTPTDPSLLGRFFEEAQISAQLGHPGVVPVHELGIDDSGRVFFTMDLVSGRTLDAIFELARKGDEDWTVARAVGLLVRVCETVAYAHSKGVVHRDLKPSNIMVGSFGEVYVLDWGLAKLLKRSSRPASAGPSAEKRRAPASAAAAPVSTDRRDASDRDTYAALNTETGQAAGTIGYMAPEQARGEVQAIDARTDVYAIGATLYALLTGSKPFAGVVKEHGLRAALDATKEGDFVPITELVEDAPPELVSIAERAMATRAEDRYPDATAMASDLRAWTEGRVVSAHERGAWAELRKWVRRNRTLAIALGVALFAVIGGTIGMAAFERNGRLAVERQQKVARVSAAPAMIAGMISQTEDTWPSTPEHIRDLESWFVTEVRLDADRRLLEDALASLKGERSTFGANELDGLLRLPFEGAMSRFEDIAVKAEWMRARLELARSLEETTITGVNAHDRWHEATASIASLPVYSGFRLEPQLGLVPLRRDPASGLWEFWHVLSGAEPRVDPSTNKWRIEEQTGVVLVLIPGGRSSVGAPTVPEGNELFDEYRIYDRCTPQNHEVTLAPFFMSKYELTQGQWRRARGRNSSQGRDGPETHPADTVSWDEALETLRRLDLVLPTEAQWEIAGRGGRLTRFYTGQDPRSLKGHVNLAPDIEPDGVPDKGQDGQPLQVFGAVWREHHTAVGTFQPNPYGLHDVHGNVMEWCLDVLDEAAAPRDGDGLRVARIDNPKRVLRGGGYNSDWTNARLTFRFSWERGNAEPDTGCRPARAVR